MTTILDTIITEKKKEVQQLRTKTIQEQIYADVGSLEERLRSKNTMGVIAEIKRASPSKGMINEDVDPVKQARIYEAHGASAISVLTDEKFFKGSMDDLRAVREAVNIPILCKDFIIDEVQIDLAKSAGANIILLIAAALDDERMHRLYQYAKTRDLEILCEVHNEEEMGRVLKLGASLIGVNNRNLKTFHVDLATTARLANMVEGQDCLFISESGIASREDVHEVARYGAKAILVGETFMRANDAGQTLADFQVALTEG